jgi:hypothetical protein
VRVYVNDILLASQAAGNGGIATESGEPHTTGSMAVKEMYDETDTRVGVAALFKGADGGTETWSYYCYAPEERCAPAVGSPTADDPIFETNYIECGACHGGNIFTEYMP